MIEVEKKFIINTESEKNVVTTAQFVGEQLIHDPYYDTPDCKLIRADTWLRSRNGQFELKIFRAGKDSRGIDSYEEIENVERIQNYLNLRSDLTEENLRQESYVPICVCRTTRREYTSGEFSVVLDHAEFDGGFSVEIGEIELMVDDTKEIEGATEKIMRFARAHGLLETPKEGKILQYFKVNRPTYYAAFQNRKIA